ncbi:hypothetical protein TWF730_010220 [Orbilia blumenaviensis]|uniref:F-box domain-containing protein n=1 Tax=Orbilia blumenaviensis TaxID=1796055 RepID=A0AAV9UR36_9PEZI
MGPSEITFLTFPYDIICGICDYLADKDVLELRLVSKSLYSKVPQLRLDQILYQQTIFLTNIDAIGLTHFITTRPDDLARIRHLTFDLANPYVKLVPFTRFRSGRWLQDEHMQSKMMAYPCIYRERSIQSQTQLKLQDTEIPAAVDGEDGVVPDDHATACIRNLYKIIEDNIKTPDVCIDSTLPSFFETLAQSLKFFPNLRILEFKLSTEPEGTNYKIPQSWRRHNPSLESFLAKNPDIEELPCNDWFSYSHFQSARFDITYNAVLFLAALAGCRISEIRANQFPLDLHTELGVAVHKFHTFGTESVPSPHLAQTLEQYTATYLNGYIHTYTNLTKLEVRIQRSGNSQPGNQISPFFLALIPNVKDLVIRGSPRVRGVAEPSFVLPTELRLPKLRRLEFVYAYIGRKPLARFLQTNKDSLKHLICTLSLEDPIYYDKIIPFLTNLKSNSVLETCQIDFPGEYDCCGRSYTFVDISGKWFEDGGACKYRAGSVSCDTDILDECMKEDAYWMETDSWEGFLECFESGTLCDNEGYWEGRSCKW